MNKPLRVAMFTNTYPPQVGGIENSVETFTADFRAMGHETLVVTLAHPEVMESDDLVFRLPAIKPFRDSTFSITLPAPSGLYERLDAFDPDIIHSHQPIMLGDTALRVARVLNKPLVFTNHTLAERYAERFGLDSDFGKRLIKSLPTEYANHCSQVVVPTQGVAEIIRQRGVTAPIAVAPTGIDTDFYAQGDRAGFRQQHGIPEDAFVIGHLGRLVPEKNLTYLAAAMAIVLKKHPDARFLLVGSGESVDPMLEQFSQAGVRDQVIFPGVLRGQDSVDAYAGMDLFVFSSLTDTQGLVIVEGMCAGLATISLNAPGPKDIIRDGMDGRLLPVDSTPEFFAEEVLTAIQDPHKLQEWNQNVLERAKEYSRPVCAQRMLDLYQEVIEHQPHRTTAPLTTWDRWVGQFTAEWELINEKAATVWDAVMGDEPN